MSYNEEQITKTSQPILDQLTDLLTWQWEEKKEVLLAEFASGKTEDVLKVLKQSFLHEWDKHSIKKAPKSLLNELGDHANLTKNQTLYTLPPKPNQPTVVAILWPWGHGSTLSLRLTLLTEPYEYTKPIESSSPIKKLLEKVKHLFA